MTLLIIYLAVLLPCAALVGWRCSNSPIWKSIDLVYYPLGAVGVLLLFSSTNAQRRLVDLAQAQDAARVEISQMNERRPMDRRKSEFDRFEMAVQKLGAVFGEEAPACRFDKNSPECLVVRRIGRVVLPFVTAHVTQKAEEPEYRHRETCSKVERLMQELQSTALSPLAARELATFYREKANRDLPFSEALNLADDFKKRLDSLIKALPRSNQSVTDSRRMAEESYALWKVWFHLFECWERYEGTAWILKRDEVAGRLARIEETMRETRDNARDETPFMAFLRLFVWPYVIVLALALKFAKAAAGVRPATKAPGNLQPQSVIPVATHAAPRALSFRNTRLPTRPKRRGERD